MVYRIELFWYEHLTAAVIGVFRTVESQRRGTAVDKPFAADRRKRVGLEQNDINAVGAEMAVARFLNKYPRLGVNTSKDPDVGHAIEVRWTEDHHHLLLRPKDREDRVYVMVRGAMPSYEIIGWISGEDAKQPQYWKNPNNEGWCYLVPETALQPLSIATGLAAEAERQL